MPRTQKPPRATDRRKGQLYQIGLSLRKMSPIIQRHILTEQRRRRHGQPVHGLLMDAMSLIGQAILFCTDQEKYAKYFEQPQESEGTQP